MDGQAAYYGVAPEDDEPPMAAVKELRDEFAMAALAEFADFVTVTKPETMEVVAMLSYQMADAMLAARAK